MKAGCHIHIFKKFYIQEEKDRNILKHASRNYFPFSSPQAPSFVVFRVGESSCVILD